MTLMQRLSSIFKAKASKRLNDAEDPRETLDYSYERQLDLLQQMRRGVTDVAASRKRVDIQVDQLEASASKLEGQARQALEQGREDLARQALLRRESITAQLADLSRQRDILQQQEDKLVEASRRLEAKVNAFQTRKETLKAGYSAAEAQTKVNEAVAGLSEEGRDVGLALQRAEDRVAEMQARSAAVDHLMEVGALEDFTGSSDPIQAELDRGAAKSDVDLELARLKGELGSPERPELEPPSEEEK
ncbi:MAG: PspA/IM30 family protein [Actinomycetota bacterium]|nr:PspA/IM30 family protein [Actinomycetota bacterium]